MLLVSHKCLLFAKSEVRRSLTEILHQLFLRGPSSNLSRRTAWNVTICYLFTFPFSVTELEFYIKVFVSNCIGEMVDWQTMCINPHEVVWVVLSEI